MCSARAEQIVFINFHKAFTNVIFVKVKFALVRLKRIGTCANVYKAASVYIYRVLCASSTITDK